MLTQSAYSLEHMMNKLLAQDWPPRMPAAHAHGPHTTQNTHHYNTQHLSLPAPAPTQQTASPRSPTTTTDAPPTTTPDREQPDAAATRRQHGGRAKDAY